jgi:hypothetical protein
MPTNAKTLSELKDHLYKTFNRAIDDHDGQYNGDTAEKRGNAARRAQEAAASIVRVEHEIEVLGLLKAVREEGGSIAFETGPDGSTKISVLNPIRLKGTANAP